MNGGLWPLEGALGVLSDFHYGFVLDERIRRFPKFTQADLRTTFQAGGRRLFEGQTLESTWSELRRIYLPGLQSGAS